MILEILPDALSELRDSARYFDSLLPSKYDEFMDEWYRGIEAIRLQPKLYSPDEDAPDGFEIRTYLFPRFQRRIIYQLLTDRLVVIAIAHTKNQPDYWLHRIKHA